MGPVCVDVFFPFTEPFGLRVCSSGVVGGRLVFHYFDFSFIELFLNLAPPLFNDVFFLLSFMVCGDHKGTVLFCVQVRVKTDGGCFACHSRFV